MKNVFLFTLLISLLFISSNFNADAASKFGKKLYAYNLSRSTDDGSGMSAQITMVSSGDLDLDLLDGKVSTGSSGPTTDTISISLTLGDLSGSISEGMIYRTDAANDSLSLGNISILYSTPAGTFILSPQLGTETIGSVEILKVTSSNALIKYNLNITGLEKSGPTFGTANAKITGTALILDSDSI